MEYNIINLTIDEYREILPGEVFKQAQKDGLIAYGAIEDDNLEALCFACDSPLEPGEAEIKYIFVQEQNRRKKIGSRLLEAFCSFLRSNRFRAVNVINSGDAVELMPGYKFFIKNGFIPVEIKGRVLAYPLRDLARSKFAEVLMGTKGALRKAAQKEACDDSKIEVFLKKTGGFQGIDASLDELDSKLSGFFLRGREVVGAVNVIRQDEGIALVQGPAVNFRRAPYYVYPSLLAEAIKIVKTGMEDDTRLVLIVNNEMLQSALVHLLGPGDSDIMIHKYKKILI